MIIFLAKKTADSAAPKVTRSISTSKAANEKSSSKETSVSSPVRRRSLLPTTINPKSGTNNTTKKATSTPEKSSEVAKVIRNIEEKIKSKSLSPVKQRKRPEAGGGNKAVPATSLENLSKNVVRTIR